MRRVTNVGVVGRRPLSVRAFVSAALAVCVAAAGAGPAAPAAAFTAPGYDFAALDTLLTESTDGCVVTCGLVLHVQRRWADGAGGPHQLVEFDDWGSLTTASEVWTASAGKLVTGITVMTVVDDGLLSLDTTVGSMFPAYAADSRGAVTVRQLLSHTSGWTSPASCLTDPATTLAACVDEILTLPLSYPPGARFAYAGPPMQVAARMVELATGKPWVQVFDENVAQPLGLPTMHWASSTNPRVDGGVPPVGLRATPADYERVLEMLLDGGAYRGTPVLSAAAHHELITDHTVGTIKQVSPNKTAAGYGLGTWVQRKDASGNTTMIMSMGAFGSVPWVDFARGYAGWWQASGDSRKIQPLWEEALAMIDAQIDAVAPSTRPAPAAPAVSTLSASAGPVAGGQSVVITGSGFLGASGVRFSSSLPATSFTVDSPTQITAVSPARVAGYVNVIVTGPLGSSAIGPQTLYRFADAPVVTRVAPSSAPTGAGTTVNLTGAGFGGATGVRFGPDTWASAYTVWSPTVISVVVPPRPAGLVNVVVQTPGGLSAVSSSTLFTYQSAAP
jgi:CubicO group peptidase (beta-lactamase class C family)